MKKHTNRYWLYGRHACLAALENPNRQVFRALASKNSASDFAPWQERIRCEIIDSKQFSRHLPPDAVHQGMALEVAPLPSITLDDITTKDKPLIVLDQVSDPHNVGAILRSAAAFNLAGVVVHDRHAPAESGAMAKAACGALDMVHLVSVNNIAQALNTLQQSGYWCIGLDSHTDTVLADISFTPRTALVLGAEGKGLRRLTKERCDQLACLPIHGQMESLNVSNAAAIAMYLVSQP